MDNSLLFFLCTIFYMMVEGEKIEKIGSTSGLNPGGDFFAYKLKV